MSQRGLSDVKPDYFKIGEINFSWPGENGTFRDFGSVNYTMPSGPWYWPWCPLWRVSQHPIFQLSNILFVAAYCAPSTKKGQLWMHTILIFGFMLYSIWAWHVICSPDAFSWNFGFVFLNLGQVVYLVYEMRPVKFDPELEEVYHTLFEPFKNSEKYIQKFTFVLAINVGLEPIKYVAMLLARTYMNLICTNYMLQRYIADVYTMYIFLLICQHIYFINLKLTRAKSLDTANIQNNIEYYESYSKLLLRIQATLNVEKLTNLKAEFIFTGCIIYTTLVGFAVIVAMYRVPDIHK